MTQSERAAVEAIIDEKENEVFEESTGQVTGSLLEISMSAQLSHGQAVGSLAFEIGKEMDLPEQACRDLAVAGYFHDIGKTELELPPDIVDPLVIEEINYVRLHPIKGHQILKRHGYSDKICDYVLYHHENYDGSGYPEHREGRDIPLGASILRVCDVFCSLLEDRPHRSAFSPADAFDLMREEIKYFDLSVFLALQRVIHDETGEIRVPEISDEVKGVWRTSCH